MSTEQDRPALLNVEVARQKVPGGDAGLRQMAELLDSECERLMQELSEAKAEDDASRFRRAAHTLKSSASVFGVTPVVEVARDLEGIGRAGNLEGTGDQVAELETLLARLREELKSLIEELPS